MNKNTERRCYDCSFCVKDDGQPYCVMKDLYTNVYPKSICDEINIRGEYYFREAEEKK